jgi:hypothetical protein
MACSTCNRTRIDRLQVKTANKYMGDCPWSLQFLHIIKDQAEGALKSYVQSQINIYRINCRLYEQQIKSLLHTIT